MICHKQLMLLFMLTIPLYLSSCASSLKTDLENHGLAYSIYDENERLKRHAPVFIVEEAEKKYNLIGTPEASIDGEQETVATNPGKATVYTDERVFYTEKGVYTNLIYRIHFSEVPFALIPFYLGAGKNVGLIVIVTLDSGNQPVLYTLAHTCGCYLAFIPTTLLDLEFRPQEWKEDLQSVYGERLPGLLRPVSNGANLFTVQLRTATHRVKHAWYSTPGDLAVYRTAQPQILPLASLESLPLPDGRSTSFFETEGSREGYVKGSHKIWERIFISWWAFDWRVGEDKKLGRDSSDGAVFYTSLKPWARKDSDMRDFARFLRYWGWGL